MSAVPGCECLVLASAWVVNGFLRRRERAFKIAEIGDNMEIDEIRQCRQFAPLVADRIWAAWWRARGYDISLIADLVAANLASTAVRPFCLVAHEGGTFMGTVSCIVSDVAARPALTPWIAALWVEPEQRRKSVATALLSESMRRACAQGEPLLFLHCRSALLRFYQARGWQLFEQNAPDPGLHILSFSCP